MRKTNRKFTALILSLVTLCSATALTVYADPDDVTTSYDDTVVSEPGGGDVISDPEPYVPPVVQPDPSYVDPAPSSDTGDNTPSYDGGQSTYEPQQPDPYQQEPQQETPQENPEPTINYDADYYNNMYGGNVISYDMNTEFNDDYQNAVVDNYNLGMTFDEFEKATDYQSATADLDNTVDMYTSNGSIREQNLSKKDWQEISLSFDKGSANGTGDFSFIKNNNSDQDSNLSVLFLIVGILFVLTAVSIVIYMIICVTRRNQKQTAVSQNKPK